MQKDCTSTLKSEYINQPKAGLFGAASPLRSLPGLATPVVSGKAVVSGGGFRLQAFQLDDSLNAITGVAVTQIGPGPFDAVVTRAVAEDVVMVRLRFTPLAVCSTLPDPSYVTFLMPLCWKGAFRFNGWAATEGSLFLAAGPDGYFTRGEGCDMLAIRLPRRRFQAAAAASPGVGPAQAGLAEGAFALPPETARRLRRRLVDIVEDTAAQEGKLRDPRYSRAIAREVFDSLLEAYLRATPSRVPRCPKVRGPERIVRLAERRFMAVDNRRVLLGDLCVAAGVGETTLNSAFQCLLGEPPIRYFHMRRMNLARSNLVRAVPARSVVKCAALDAGITELGRFSVEYRRLFGESPSVTSKKALAFLNRGGLRRGDAPAGIAKVIL